MKKTFLFMFLLSLGVMFVSCEKDDDKPKDEENELAYISNTFEAIKVIHDNLGADAEKTPADLVKLYDEKIKDNIALTEQPVFANWIGHMKDNADQTAEAGKAGKLGKRFLNEKGIELPQMVKKGFIGSFQLNGFNKALREGVQAKTKEDRKKALDKGVAYLLGDVSYLEKAKDADGAYPVYPGSQFSHYMNKVSTSEKYKNIGDDLYNVFKDAYTKTDDASAYSNTLLEINKLVVTIVAFRGVHYLTKGEELQGGFSEDAAHEVSEGLGFCYSLQFAYKPHGQYYLTKEQAEEFTTVDLWGAGAPEFLDNKANEIADLFDFTVADAK